MASPAALESWKTLERSKLARDAPEVVAHDGQLHGLMELARAFEQCR